MSKVTIEEEIREIRRKLSAEFERLTPEQIVKLVSERTAPIVAQYGLNVINHPDEIKRRTASP